MLFVAGFMEDGFASKAFYRFSWLFEGFLAVRAAIYEVGRGDMSITMAGNSSIKNSSVKSSDIMTTLFA